MFRRDPTRILSDRLLKDRLVTTEQLAAAKAVAADAGPEALVAALEKTAAVNAYQAGRLRANDFDSLVVGGYKLTYQNAAGSFARVYRAQSLTDGRVVALKLLRGRHSSDAKGVAGFHREAKLVQRLRHKNIVPILDVGSEGSNHFYTMEFVEGGNLRDFLAVRKKLSPEEATRYALDIAEGLEHALTAGGMTHRDMKLSNVLITTAGVAKLVDFGLAGEETSGGADLRAVEYAALEKATDAPKDDPRSDLFFLGAVYYELLTGVPPWPATNDRQERKQASRYRDVRPIAQVDPSLPRSVVEVVERLMEWEPRRRCQTPTEAVADLRAALEGEASRGRQPAGSALDSRPSALDSNKNPRADALGSPASSSAAKPASRPDPQVLCLERHAKRQDVLRDYLGKRGFRPLFMTDPARVVQRLDTNPPEALIVMGDAAGDDLPDLYNKVRGVTAEESLVAVFVLTQEQAARRDEFEQTPTCRVLAQPLSVRELRRQLQLGLKHVLTESRLIKLPPIPD